MNIEQRSACARGDGPAMRLISWLSVLALVLAMLCAVLVLVGCGSSSPAPQVPVVTPTWTPYPTVVDPRFPSCEEAIDAGYGPYTVDDPEFGWYVDRDGDGVVCEQ